MSVDLLFALESHRTAKRRGIAKDFPFQHKLCHDFESLIWVIVYAMMVRRKTIMAATDSNDHADYKALVDSFWGAHSHSRLGNCHESLVNAGIRRSRTIVEELLFSDPLEAEFFRAAMYLLRPRSDEEGHITYKEMQGLFRTYIQKAERATGPILAAA